MTFQDLMAHADMFALYFCAFSAQAIGTLEKEPHYGLQRFSKVTGSPPKKSRRTKRNLEPAKGISDSKWRKVLVVTTQS